ncbi:MAG: TetR/AcrR family transcriptional regulator [bacterium]
MTPRPYQSKDRQKSSDAGREKIIAAARELLESDGDESFSIDAVARRAGIARMTIYNQFESKAGLLEALFDELAQRAQLTQLSEIFREPDPFRALDLMIEVFARFWTGNRRAHRRLRAAAMVDTELYAAIDQRNERRRRGLTEIVARIPPEHVMPMARDETVRVLFMVLSFQSFDTIAGEGRTPADVVPVVQQLTRLIVGAR